jgi:Pectate lyase superfamily protein
MPQAINQDSMTRQVFRLFWAGWVCLLAAGLTAVAQPFSSTDVYTLKCKANNLYVTVQAASGLNLAANRTNVGALQLFSILDGGSGSYALRANVNDRYVSAESAGAAPLVANRTAIGSWEQFDLVAEGGGEYALRARVNNMFVTASQGNLIANQATAGTEWEKFIIQTNAPVDPIHWRVVRPQLNPEEVIVAACTPQDFGAKGDGVTDDTDGFQDALGTVAALGGGVIFVPAGQYAFQGTLVVPDGVTLHGDWEDWTTNSTGAVGTIFKVYGGRGQTNGTPFIFLKGSTALKGVTIWYPDQDPTNIVPYPFCIGDYGDDVVQNVILVNPYQGIQVTPPTSGAKHIFSTLIGTPLYKGLDLDMIADIGHLEDVRFNPDIWPASKLPGAPTADGPHAAWMRANGTGMRLLRIDGETCIDTFISGYKVGIESNRSTNGTCGATFYSGSVTNCGTALFAADMAGQSGLMFTKFDFEGDTCVNSQPPNSGSYLEFHTCRLTGLNGTAAILGGDWSSRIQFQNCTINGTLRQYAGTYSIVNSTLSVAGGYQLMIYPNATRTALVGCNFIPARSIYNLGLADRVILDDRRATPSPMPDVNWQKVKQDYLSRQPARTNLYIVTDAPWNAKGDGITDDTASIQSALNSAGDSGGGIVFLPGGQYKLLGSLEVPSGVELRGTYELRHRTWPGEDGEAKGAILQPYANQGQTSGPPAIALEANSGLVGVTISYEAQDPASLTPYPVTIQGRGGNVYVIGVVSPNAWYYVDLDSYTCTNHLIYMADGFGLRKGFTVGNGSSGSIVDCHANWTYWIDNYASQSRLDQADQDYVKNFIEHNNEAYILGDCSELLVKDFWIFTRFFTRFIEENGRGPNATCFAHMCDITVEGYRFEANAPCNVNVINPTLAILADYQDVTNSTVGITSTSNFLGHVRFFNTALFGRPHWDFIIGGGDVGFDLFHMFDHSINGARVDGGTLHLINKSSWIAYNQTFPVYQIYFGPDAGTPGKISEVICCSASNGVEYTNANPANVVQAWVNFPLLTLTPTTPYTLSPPQLLSSLDEVGSNFKLYWQGDIGYFGLYQTSDLTPPVEWTEITNTPLYSNNQWFVTLPLNTPRACYRLKTP